MTVFSWEGYLQEVVYQANPSLLRRLFPLEEIYTQSVKNGGSSFTEKKFNFAQIYQGLSSLVYSRAMIITEAIENSWFCYSLAGLASSGFGYRRPGPHHFHSHGSEMMKQIHQVSPKYIIIKASPTDKKPTFKGALIKENTWIYWNPKISPWDRIFLPGHWLMSGMVGYNSILSCLTINCVNMKFGHKYWNWIKHVVQSTVRY